MRCFIFQTAPLIHVIALETQRKALGMFCLWEQVRLFNYAEMWFLHNCGFKKKAPSHVRKKLGQTECCGTVKNYGETLTHWLQQVLSVSAWGHLMCYPTACHKTEAESVSSRSHLIDKARSPREVAALCSCNQDAHGSRTPPHSDPQDLARGYQANTDS